MTTSGQGLAVHAGAVPSRGRLRRRRVRPPAGRARPACPSSRPRRRRPAGRRLASRGVDVGTRLADVHRLAGTRRRAARAQVAAAGRLQRGQHRAGRVRPCSTAGLDPRSSRGPASATRRARPDGAGRLAARADAGQAVPRGRRLRPQARRRRRRPEGAAHGHRGPAGRRARLRRRPRPHQAGGRWAPPRPAAPTSSSSPTTTPAPRTPPRSAPPSSTARRRGVGRRTSADRSTTSSDRAAAIAAAVRGPCARPGDTVVAVVGKGHENGQDVGGRRPPLRRPRRCSAQPSAAATHGRNAVIAAVPHRDRQHHRRAAHDITGRDGRPPRRRRPRRHGLPGGRARQPLRRPRRRARRRPRLRRGGRRARCGRRPGHPRPSELPGVVVDDIQAGARPPSPARSSSGAPDLTVVGITGSSGKTSTKDLLASVLRQRRRPWRPSARSTTRSASRSPLFRVTAETRFLVARDGRPRDRPHRVPHAIAPPRIGVVLNVGTAHVGEFGSREAIAHRQGRAGRGAARPTGSRSSTPTTRWCGHGVADGARVHALRRAAPMPTSAPTTSSSTQAGRPTFRLHTPAGCSRRDPARCTVSTTSATPSPSAAVALELRPVARLGRRGALRVRRARSRWRMEVTERPDGVTVVNDAYNANPDSMRAALDALARDGRRGRPPHLGGARQDGRARGRVLAEHDAVGRLAVRLNVDRARRGRRQGRGLAADGAQITRARGARSRCTCPTPTRRTTCSQRTAPGDVVLLKSQPPVVGLERSRSAPLGRRRGEVRRREGGPDRGRHRPLRCPVGTPMLIKFLVSKGYGQFIRDDGPTLAPHQARHAHHGRRGHLGARSSAYFARAPGHRQPPTCSGLLVLFLMTGLGLVGFLDDYIKISKQRSLGLRAQGEAGRPDRSWRRLRGAGAAVPQRPHRTPASTYISFVRDTDFGLAFAGTLVGCSCSSSGRTS